MTLRVVKVLPSPVTQADKDDITAALAAAPGDTPLFADVRAQLLAGRRARFTDGMIHQTVIELGLKVVE